MDLSFSGFDKRAEVTALAPDLSVLLVGIAARQAASRTAMVQARIQSRIASLVAAPSLLAPLDGHFNAPVAAMMKRWKKE